MSILIFFLLLFLLLFPEYLSAEIDNFPPNSRRPRPQPTQPNGKSATYEAFLIIRNHFNIKQHSKIK